jgi:hypothetical protein
MIMKWWEASEIRVYWNEDHKPHRASHDCRHEEAIGDITGYIFQTQ